ncbi:MAG: hypothetical protein ACREJU_04020, partial [Nitrospiraceae bacterium]
MAKALGAEVRPGRAIEIGMTPICLTEEGRTDPVFGRFPGTFEAFEWHGEIFDLPKDCVASAGSEVRSRRSDMVPASMACCFIWRGNKGIETLCRECPDDLIHAKQSLHQVIRTATLHLPSLPHIADPLLGIYSHLSVDCCPSLAVPYA